MKIRIYNIKGNKTFLYFYTPRKQEDDSKQTGAALNLR